MAAGSSDQVVCPPGNKHQVLGMRAALILDAAVGGHGLRLGAALVASGILVEERLAQVRGDEGIGRRRGRP